MKRYSILSPMSLAVLFVAIIASQTSASIKGTPPKYIGLGEFENPSQGINFSVPFSGKEAANPNVPIITDAYAIDAGIYGTILKIYVEADDPNGEMSKIATTVDEVGYGHYPTDFIILKAEYRHHFKGYIQWNTFSSHSTSMHEFVRVYVTVTVMDKSGRLSNDFVFPFTFETGVGLASNPPAPFDQGRLARLGYVSLDLFDPYDMGGQGGIRR